MNKSKAKPAPPVVGRSVDRGWRSLAGSGKTALVPQARMAGPMPWVVAIMVAITVIAAAGALALGNLATRTSSILEGGVTIQVLEADAEQSSAQIEAAIPALRDLAGVLSVRRVPQAELEGLVAPWLGEEAVESADVPVPAMIDLRLRGDPGPADVTRIEQAIAPFIPDARVDLQASWLGPIYSAIESLRWLALALIVLLGAATSAVVLLAARTAIAAHRETIEMVHMLGGTDGQITRIFQRSIAVDAAGGGAVGLGLALVTLLALATRFVGLGEGLAGQATLGVLDWVILALVPVLAVILAVVTARFTVRRSLGKML